MIALWIAAGIVLFLGLALLITTYVIYAIAFGAPERKRPDPYAQHVGPEYDTWREHFDTWIHALDDRPYEALTISSSHDKTRLFARYLHVRDGAPLVIQMHGYRSSSIRDFCGGAPYALDRLGHNVLLVDQRAHGKSGGHTISFGIVEQYDCLDWIRYAVDRFGADTPIVLYGVSMGAATVLTASGLPLPPSVRGIVADCPYSRPSDIIKKTCREMGLPPRLAFPFVRLAARLYGGFALSDKGPHPVEAVTRASVPILLIHGEADDFVPCDMSRRIAAANPDRIRLETFPGGVHAGSYLIDPDRYNALLREAMQVWGVPCQSDYSEKEE